MDREKRRAGRQIRKRRRFRRRLAAFSEAMGIALLPWQVQVMECLAFDGDKRGPRV